MMVLEIVFWGAAVLVLYAYGVFPLILWLRGVLVRRPCQRGEITPAVSMIIAAYNEEASIAKKLDNLLALDYPPDRLEVIIASDGSSDGTEAIVQRYAGRGVRLLALPRQGKAAALNAAVAAAGGEVLVFSDANSLYAPDAIHALVRPLADPQVGGVAGNQVYLPEGAGTLAAAGERLYWGLDRKLKQLGSQVGHVISATGAIYAIRRRLFQPVPEGVTDDFVTSTRVIAQGYRLVFAADAVAYEPVAKSSGVEFGRKVRVMTRGLRGVLVMRQLLNPFRYGFYALQLFSHKVLRRLVAVPLLLLLLVSPWLWERGWYYQATALAQFGFYGLALAGALTARRRIAGGKLLSIPFYFCLVNAAALLAALNLLRGQRIVRWEPQRAPAQEDAAQEDGTRASDSAGSLSWPASGGHLPGRLLPQEESSS